MPCKSIVYATVLREKLIAQFGGKCRECDCKEKLEFAHIKPTLVSGKGRGKIRRTYDVKNNPDCYALLCHRHHKEFDEKETSSG